MSLPHGRTGHACAQCRHRKQKCGGLTYGIRCQPCTARKVKCSFQDEVMGLRQSPYLRGLDRRSPSSDQMRPSASTAAIIPALTAFDRDAANSTTQPMTTDASVHETASRPPEPVSSIMALSEINGDTGLPEQVQSLTSRIVDLEKQLASARYPSNQPARLLPSPPSRSLDRPQEPIQHDNRSLSTAFNSSSPGDSISDGPLRTLNRFQGGDDPAIEVESNDPVYRSTLTQGEAHVIFKLFFSHGHPNAPFLDASVDSDPERVRSASTLLYLAILSVGARFWSASSRSSCWLHPRYPELIRLLDAEMMHATLRPGVSHHKLETVQAFMLCAHWMPFDVSTERESYQSRFSEAGAWHCLGLALRWATSLALERTCHVAFQSPETVTREDSRKFRTMLYLIESDHYLALSARRPLCLDPKPFHDAIPSFTRCPFVQSTDLRITSLFQVAYGAHFTGCRPTTIESVEAFDQDVQLIEKQFFLSQNSQQPDAMDQQFPYTSLRWYRLSYTCAFLDSAEQNRQRGKALTWATEWASQILFHLSSPASGDVQLEPNPAVVEVMSFAIDHYFVVIAYAALFLVNSWLRNFVDINLNTNGGQLMGCKVAPNRSLLYRLVDVAARTLEAASPPKGHLARRYVSLLRGMADLVLTGNNNAQICSTDTDAVMAQARNEPEQLAPLGEELLWDMWQEAGLQPINWPSLLNDMH